MNAHSVAVGPIIQAASTGLPDFISASRDRGTIELHRSSTNATRFEQEIYQNIQVPGGPRALQIVDLDHDGWNDLAVVLRNFDRVLTYHNSNGVFVAETEMTVGTSPREIVAGNFNGDAYPDVAVMNRDSEDVSILFTYPGQTGFAALVTGYPD